jgi:hypothetical protein
MAASFVFGAFWTLFRRADFRHDHLEHHRKLKVSYAAPTISIDRVLEALWPDEAKKL